MYLEALKEILLSDKFLQEKFNESYTGKVYAMRHGSGTAQLASKLVVSQSKARYHLNKLNKQGLVNKHWWDQNFCCWFPLGWDCK